MNNLSPGSKLQCLEAILSNLDLLIYVSDMQTQELLFVSDYGRKVWGEPKGKRCFEYLQYGMTSRCDFCTNDKLLDADGQPLPVHIWEFQNTQNQRWYQCRDQAIRWHDGRMVRMEVAIDITDRKEAEHKLSEAYREAEQLARIDVLTRVGNRRAFFESLHQQIARASRQAQPLCVATFDIDWFKRVNDTYGHAVGDDVLQGICQRVQAEIRASDQLFRIGGEEFMIILPDTPINDALALVERVRLGIAEMVFDGDEHQLTFSVTCSFGLAAYAPGVSEDDLLLQADKALYAAKSAGRNQSKVFGTA